MNQVPASDLAVIHVNHYIGPTRRAALGITTDSAAGLKKIDGLVRALRTAGVTVVLLSLGGRWPRRRFKWLPGGFEPAGNGTVVEYASVLDIPFLSAISSVVATCRLIRRRAAEQRAAGRAVCLVFYNTMIDTTATALYSRLFLRLPICLEFSEETYLDPTLSGTRRAVVFLAQRLVRPFLGGALLASSSMKSRLPSIPTVQYPGIAYPDLVQEHRAALDDDAVVAGSMAVTCLFSSSLDEVRGARLVIAAMQLADADYTFPASRLRIVVMGRGPLESDVRRACLAMRRLCVEFAGFTSETAYREALVRAHIALALQDPGLAFSRLSFPSKVIDYLVAGALVVTTDVADMARLGGTSVLLLESATPQALVGAWRDVIANPRHYAGIAREGQRLTLDTWSLARVGRETTSLLRQMITSRG